MCSISDRFCPAVPSHFLSRGPLLLVQISQRRRGGKDNPVGVVTMTPSQVPLEEGVVNCERFVTMTSLVLPEAQVKILYERSTHVGAVLGDARASGFGERVIVRFHTPLGHTTAGLTVVSRRLFQKNRRKQTQNSRVCAGQCRASADSHVDGFPAARQARAAAVCLSRNPGFWMAHGDTNRLSCR